MRLLVGVVALLLVGCQTPKRLPSSPLPPGGHSARANAYDPGQQVALVPPLPTDLWITRFELLSDPPDQNFVAYCSTGNACFALSSNRCQQVLISYESPVECAVFYKETPEPGTNIMTGPQVNLAWDSSPDSNVLGYAIYAGTNSGDFRQRFDASSGTNITVRNLTEDEWFFVATAYTAEGVESLPSNEVSAPLPIVSTGSVLILPDFMRISTRLSAGTNTLTFPIPKADSGFVQLRPF